MKHEAKKPHHVDVHVGARVKEMRTLRGMSQEKLGEACGLTFQQIQKYERGANRMGASRLYQVAKALGVAPAWFFQGLDVAGGDGAGATETFRREHLELIRNFDRIPHAPTRKQIYGLVKTVADEQQTALQGARATAERRDGGARLPAQPVSPMAAAE